MFLKPTPQLRKQIQDSGKPVIKFDLEEFQKMFSQGKVLTNAEVHKTLSKNTVSNSSKKTTCPSFLPPAKVRVYESVGKGLGVFATENIPKGEIIETCHLIPLTISQTSDILKDYRFNYPKHLGQEYVIPLGFGCIYNHSDNPNADWFDHPEWKAFNFVALKDIEPGEEICTYYGGEEYWSVRQHIELI